MSASNLPQQGAMQQQQQQLSAQAHAQAQAQVQVQAQSQAQVNGAQLQRQPKQQLSRQLSHRRGQSLDTRRQQLQQRQQRQQQIQQQQIMAEAVAASVHTIQGNPTTTQQHILRETQTQRTARPGIDATQQFAKQSRAEAFLLAQQHQQQQQQQDRVAAAASSFDFYTRPTAAMMRKTLSGGGLPSNQQDFQLFACHSQQGLQSPNAFIGFQEPNHASVFVASAASPPGWTSEDETSSTRRASRRVSDGIMDRVAKFEDMASMEIMQRPVTPPRQNDNSESIHSVCRLLRALQKFFFEKEATDLNSIFPANANGNTPRENGKASRHSPTWSLL